jgi:hypothetical protein
MKLKVLLIGMILSSSLINLSNASAGDQPTTEVFTASQVDVDLNNPDLKINFEIIFTHPDGLGDTSTTLILTNGGTNTISTPLIRTDNPINFSNTRVVYRGSITIPRTFTPGVYTYSVDGVTSNLSNGLRYPSGTISGPLLRSLKGAEFGILVRNKGFLDLNYSTINGPTYESQSGKSYTNMDKYLSVSEPIWKVGETINPNDYFESTIPGNKLQVATTTPSICSVDSNLMKLISVGDCSFTISTPRTNEYLPKIIYQSKSITAPRKPQTLTIESIAAQSAKNLPITLLLSQVYASGVSAVEYVIPKSITPEICETGGYVLKIVSGGTCSITYKSLGNTSYLPSETYTQTIIIEKQAQTIAFQPIQSVDIKSKSFDLIAIASGKGAISFSTTSAGICSITGSTLSLIRAGNCSITANAAGTTIFAPVSATVNILLTGTTVTDKKTINCIKGKTTKKVTGINPRCPAGYKIKK